MLRVSALGILTPKTYGEVQRLDKTDSGYVGVKLTDLITDQVAFFNTVTDRKNTLESMLKAAITLEDRRCAQMSWLTALSRRQRIWTRSFATKRECIDNLIGLWKDCWRLKKPAKMRLASWRNVLLQPRNCKNEANKSCIFNM